MNNKQKFENFLESLKGKDHDALIESVKRGFQTYMNSKKGITEGAVDVGELKNKLVNDLELVKTYIDNLIPIVSRYEDILTTDEYRDKDKNKEKILDIWRNNIKAKLMLKIDTRLSLLL